MSIKFSGYKFEGPYKRSSTLENRSGVYLILKEVSKNRFRPIYVGESKHVRTRVTNNHEREDCWEKNNFTDYAVHYITGEDNRLAIESEIKKEYEPTCNKK